MPDKATPQQRAAIEKQGRVIVSASAGSGKTFVMIRRLADYVEGGGDLDEVLAVTFTKKAAAQMKEKLRAELIKRADDGDADVRAHIKKQLSKIASANISTIHSFCGYLLRVYFYLLDIDGSFEIVSEDAGAQATLRSRAMDGLFEELYESGDEGFLYLLERYTKKRSDENLKKMVAAAYDDVRNLPAYRQLLTRAQGGRDERSFNDICGAILEYGKKVYAELIAETEQFCLEFPDMEEGYKRVAGEMLDILHAAAARSDLFDPLPPFSTSQKPRKKGEGSELDDRFSELRKYVKDKYDGLLKGLSDRQTELDMFLESGRCAAEFDRLLLAFDDAYSAVKREEGKLDYGDLEHLTLRLLDMDGMGEEVRSRFKRVFVDEYQDVNPVQERIITLVGGENLFLVGDVKQAIYGFRGSRSEYFTRKAEEFSAFGGSLLLPHNFRSAPEVIDFVNGSFSQLMRPDTCGIDYRGEGAMITGGGYTEGSGGAYLHLFGKEEKEKTEADGVYSVLREGLKARPQTLEGGAVLQVVLRELSGTLFDPEQGKERRVEPGDICILTRKRDNSSAAGIYRALTGAGLPVSGAQGGNVCDLPEVKQLIDILSFIDNGEQDIPLASAMLSPAGGFDEDELAAIRIAFAREKGLSFRECCSKFAATYPGPITKKIELFNERMERYRGLAELFGAGTVTDAVLRDTALEAEYYRDGGKKLKNVRRLAQAAYTPAGELSVNEFLRRLKAGGYDVELPEPGGGDSIKVMTMHSSKGLEFPIVILADVMRPYRGREDGSLPLSDKFGFAHKYFDLGRRVCKPTVLGRLCRLEGAREEVRNEMNLLYVACTRAKYRLHVMSQEEVRFNRYRVASAANYAQMLDFSLLRREETDEEYISEQPSPVLITAPDEQAYEALKSKFMPAYAFADSIDLPVKTSATAVMKLFDDEPAEAVELFREDEGGGADAQTGTAYHRFLQLCDFAVKDKEGIAREIADMAASGALGAGQAELIDADNLAKILSMPCFGRTEGAQSWRERAFLCALPANAFLESAAEDDVLVQGAIDLLCVKDGHAAIIDYKYSGRPRAQLAAKYARQLELYRLAVQKILKLPRENTHAYIVNIKGLYEIDLG